VSIRREVEMRLAEVNALMRAHAGGMELVEVGADGSVSLRFAGKCTGCELRPVTMASIVRPALLAVEGVKQVTAAGVRISEEAEQRLMESLAPGNDSSRVLRMFHSYRASLAEDNP